MGWEQSNAERQGLFTDKDHLMEPCRDRETRHVQGCEDLPRRHPQMGLNETGTRHIPCVQPADVQELLDHGAQTVILGTGFYECLKV